MHSAIEAPFRHDHFHTADDPHDQLGAPHDHGDGPHRHGVAHGHSHGLVDPSIVRSREGVRAVSVSLGILLATALAQTAIFVLSDSVALLADVFVIFVSACVALYESVMRLIDPRDLTHLWALAGAGIIGFLGNQIAASVRLRAGRRLDSPALVADGNHARTDALVSLGVVGSAIVVALGFAIADPLIGLTITAIILKITWDSWRTIRAG